MSNPAFTATTASWPGNRSLAVRALLEIVTRQAPTKTSVDSNTTTMDTDTMVDYFKMKNAELQTLLRERNLPCTGKKADLVKRLQDNDGRDTEDAESVFNKLRRSVHQENLRNLLAKITNNELTTTKVKSMLPKIRGGSCLEPTCSLCGTGTLSESMNKLFGTESKCTDGTCEDILECCKCRSRIQETEDTHNERMRDSCADASCGNLARCFRCETCIRDVIIPTSLPEYLQGPLDPTKESSDDTELKHVLAEERRSVHNEHLRKLCYKLQEDQPDPVEWINIKSKLGEGECLGTTCSLCGPGPLAESLKILSAGPEIDCGGDILSTCGDTHSCPSCRQSLQDMDDRLARSDKGTCNSGLCGIVPDCLGCQRRPQDRASSNNSNAGDSSNADDNSMSDADEDMSSSEDSLPHLDEVDDGWPNQDISCWNEAERRNDRQAAADRWQRRRQCDGADPMMPYGLGCGLFDCQRCGMIEAHFGPRIRNDALRRRRANEFNANASGSVDNMAADRNKRKRSHSYELCYPLPSGHPLARCIRREQDREMLERQRARRQHDQPSWFGTQEDPQPDLWMGRPVLTENNIRTLKVSQAIPKFYLSQSEDDMIRLPEGPREIRLGTIIRRLEAELMSRDFWMQSLGFDAADDGSGVVSAGRYRVADA